MASRASPDSGKEPSWFLGQACELNAQAFQLTKLSLLLRLTLLFVVQVHLCGAGRPPNAQCFTGLSFWRGPIRSTAGSATRVLTPRP